MSSTNLQNIIKDFFEIYQRLFDHQAAVRGEVNYFFDNFKDGPDCAGASGDNYRAPHPPSQLETVLHALQSANEANDVDWPKIVQQSDLDKVAVKLDAAALMMQRLIERGRTKDGAGPYGDYMLKTKEEQKGELELLSTDIQGKKDRVDEEFVQKIEDLKKHFENLSANKLQ